MNAYEILLMLDPELAEERSEEILARTRQLIEGGGGAWESHEIWGRRKLAYQIDHKDDGAYHLLLFQAAPETLDEISRVLKITDGVMRHIGVRRPSTRPPEPVARRASRSQDAGDPASTRAEEAR